MKYVTYPVKNLGNSILKFILFLEGKQRFSCDFFFKNFYTVNYSSKDFNLYNKCSFFLGNSILFRVDSKSFLSSFLYFFKKIFNFIYFNLINSFLGFYSYSNIISYKKFNEIKNIDFLYTISDDFKFDINFKNLIYQNFIKSKLYYKADLILPITGFYEFDSHYINMEGRFRVIKQVIKNSSVNYTN
jgi:hypothetical protein